MRVWDLATGRELAALTGHAGPVLAVAVTEDGTRAVSGETDRRCRCGTWPAPGARHSHRPRRQVFSVAVTADGTRAVSGSSDGSVRVWDLATGRELAALTGHTRPVLAVAVSPDGTLAVSGGEDVSVRVWDLAAGPRSPAGRRSPIIGWPRCRPSRPRSA